MRVTFPAPTKPVLFAKGSGIAYVVKRDSLILFRRDQLGGFHLLHYAASNLSRPPRNILMESFPSRLIMDSSGRTVVWFSSFGGSLRMMDLKTGAQKLILQRKSDEKGFWMDPPYEMAFETGTRVLAFGYPVSEDGTGGTDGVYSIDLTKTGPDAITLMVTYDELVKRASGVNSAMRMPISISDESPLILYGIPNGSDIDLFSYDLQNKTESKIDQCATIDHLMSEPKGSIVYDCAQNQNSREVILYSRSTRERKIIISGSDHLLAFDPVNGVFMLSRKKGTTTEVGISSRPNFTFVPLLSTSKLGGITAAFADDGRILIIGTGDGLWFSSNRKN